MDNDEEQQGRLLLAALDAEPTGPSRVDLGQILFDGRRRARRRTLAGSTAVASLIGILAASFAIVTVVRHTGTTPAVVVLDGPSASTTEQAPTPPSACVAHPLPLPPGQRGVTMMAIDPSGRYLVGRSVDKVGRYYALLWTDGMLSVLDPGGSDGEVDGMAVNADGTVVWSDSDAGAKGKPYQETLWRYQNGKASMLAAAAGYRAMAIDPHGTIYALDQGPLSAPPTPVSEWHARLLTMSVDGTRTVRDLQPHDASGRASVMAVDADGTAVGTVGTVGPAPSGLVRSDAVVWPAEGGTRELAVPDGYLGEFDTLTINNGRVAGGTFSALKKSKGALRWDLRTGAAQVIDPLAWVRAMNRYGWVVGADQRGQTVAVLGDQVLRLPAPREVEGGAGVTADVLSDDGRVVGGELASTMPIRWTCG